MRIAFAGNPNSGKTTMYNALTGRNEKVGNWAGVTVDKKEALIKKAYAGDKELIAVDLPGAYSMSPFTSEESITSSYVRNEHPDAIINIVDATNLSRSLFFTTQLLELGVPVVVALNKHDLNQKKQTRIDIDALSQKLGCPVIDTTSTTGDGLQAVVTAAAALEGKAQTAPYHQGDIDLTNKDAVEEADRKRFAYVDQVVSQVEVRKVLTRDKNSQDKLDAILTHPVFGLLIFAVVMFLVFQISQAWVGPWIAGYLEIALTTFQEWVGSLVENAAPILQALLVDGIIGGVIAVLAIIIHKELLIPILCGVFLVESLSVIQQVEYFKSCKRKGLRRRIFKRTPIHDNFRVLPSQLDPTCSYVFKNWPHGAWHESKITIRFWIVTILLAAATIITLKIR